MMIFDTMYVNNTSKGFYRIIPTSNQSLELINLEYPRIRCRHTHNVHLSFPSNNKITNIGEFILSIITQRKSNLIQSLSLEIYDRYGNPRSKFIRLGNAAHISVKSIDSAWNTAIVIYETANSEQEKKQLSWAYVTLEPSYVYTFKAHAPEGHLVSSLTPKGFIIINNNKAYNFEQHNHKITLEVMPYNGHELLDLMFDECNIATAIIKKQNQIFLQNMDAKLKTISPLYKCCDNGNYNMERSSENIPIIFSRSEDDILHIYPNVMNLNEKIVVTSIDPNTHNISVDAYNGHISILEYSKTHLRKTTITEVGVKHIAEPKLLPKEGVAQGHEKQAPGTPFIPLEIYKNKDTLNKNYLYTNHHRMFNIFLNGRIAHYIAPSISPQWYFTKVSDNSVAIAPTLPTEKILTKCTSEHYSKVFAVALLVGSPVDINKIKCYENLNDTEYEVEYTFGCQMFMHQQGSESRQAERHLKENEESEINWIFPHVASTCQDSTLCQESLLISTIHKFMPNKTELFEQIRQIACSYSDTDLQTDINDESWIWFAEDSQSKLVSTLGALEILLGEH